jgi:hypothetical protein
MGTNRKEWKAQGHGWHAGHAALTWANMEDKGAVTAIPQWSGWWGSSEAFFSGW